MSITANNLIENLEKKLKERIKESLYKKPREISPILDFTENYRWTKNMSIPIPDYEVEEVEGEAPPFKSVILKGHLMSTPVPIPIGLSLVNNINFDIVEHVFNLIAEDFRITQEKAILQGDGGITGLSTLNNVVETAAVDAITSDELVFIKSSIYGEHLAKNCCWVMHPDTLANIELIKDGVGRYLWNDPVSGISKAFATNLFGYPVYASENMPEPAPGKVAIYFGDFLEVMCKFSENVNLQILKEKYALQNAIGIHVELEFDAKLKDNDTKGIVALKFKSKGGK